MRHSSLGIRLEGPNYDEPRLGLAKIQLLTGKRQLIFFAHGFPIIHKEKFTLCNTNDVMILECNTNRK